MGVVLSLNSLRLCSDKIAPAKFAHPPDWLIEIINKAALGLFMPFALSLCLQGRRCEQLKDRIF